MMSWGNFLIHPYSESAYISSSKLLHPNSPSSFMHLPSLFVQISDIRPWFSPGMSRCAVRDLSFIQLWFIRYFHPPWLSLSLRPLSALQEKQQLWRQSDWIPTVLLASGCASRILCSLRSSLSAEVSFKDEIGSNSSDRQILVKFREFLEEIGEV